MPSMFDDMYIPWTPRCRKEAAEAYARKAAQVIPEQPVQPTTAPTPAKPKQFCARTLQVVKAIIQHALDPYPDALHALAAAFVAYHWDELDIPIPSQSPL